MNGRTLGTSNRWAVRLRRLARFRYELRRFLRFSERAARASGLTPQQHQLLLGVAGFTGRGWATISELAEFLQERHNAVVGLVQRAERKGLVRKAPGERDQRVVRVYLPPAGEQLLLRLSKLHQREVRKFQRGLMPEGAGRELSPRRKGKEAASARPTEHRSSR
jgi:DNA-binding MarR family transcriptional regulator